MPAGGGPTRLVPGVTDSSHVRAARRGPEAAPGPVGRARPGSKPDVLVDGQGVPPAVSPTGKNRNARCSGYSAVKSAAFVSRVLEPSSAVARTAMCHRPPGDESASALVTVTV